MAEEQKQRGSGPLRYIIAAVIVVASVAGVIAWTTAGHEGTDDAQIEGRITQISTRVGGPILEVLVKDNQYVEAGTVLARIDPREYQVAVERARAELADAQANALAAGVSVPIAEASTAGDVRSATGGVDEAKAGIEVADRQVEGAKAQWAAAQARARERQAAAAKAEKDVERFKPLVAKEEIPQQQFDAAVSTAQSLRASADAAQADVDVAATAVAVAQQRSVQARSVANRAQAELQSANTAPEQLQVSRARAAAALARVKQSEAALAQAELNLERTTIKAPSAGIVGKKSIELGQSVQASQPLMAIVARDEVWVVANFKETQLAEMTSGQVARVEVDALGGKTFTGKVDSMGAATGAKFSLLPPENATGNFVKVVQRVPVKILLDANQDPEHRLRPGLSVYATVETK
jgi:membrane fusion protein (multidrug efflux system)